MGTNVRGGMYCLQCDMPIAAQKSTHRLRNTAAVITTPVTGGYSLAGVAVEGWHCPHCGGPAYTKRGLQAAVYKREMQAQMALADPNEPGAFAWVVGVIFGCIPALVVVAATWNALGAVAILPGLAVLGAACALAEWGQARENRKRAARRARAAMGYLPPVQSTHEPTSPLPSSGGSVAASVAAPTPRAEHDVSPKPDHSHSWQPKINARGQTIYFCEICGRVGRAI